MQINLKNILSEADNKRGTLRIVGVFFLMIILISIPYFLSNYALSILNSVLLTAIAISGLNLISGFAGVMSLANAAFMGIGAFIAGILTVEFGLVWWLSIPCGGIIAMVVGLIICIPSLRLKGVYLLLATIALHFLTQFALLKYEMVTKKISGIRFPKPSVFDFVIDSQLKYYYLFLIITLLLLLFIYNLMRTAIGRSLMAVRDNESAAKAMGVNIVRTKLIAFAVSSFIIGIAGGLQGIFVRNINSEMYGFHVTFDHICGLFIGGISTLSGPILGSAFITILPDLLGSITRLFQEFLPFFAVSLEKFHYEIQYFFYGLSIVLVLMFKPDGVNGFIRDSFGFVRKIVFKK